MPIFPQKTVWFGMETMEDELRERDDRLLRCAICQVTCSLQTHVSPIPSHSSPVSLSECPYRYPHLEEVVQASGSVLGLYHQIP